MSERRISLAFIFLALVGAVSISLLIFNSSKPEKTTQPAGGNTVNTILITVAVFSVVSFFFLMLWRMFDGRKGVEREKEYWRNYYEELGKPIRGQMNSRMEDELVAALHHTAKHVTDPQEINELRRKLNMWIDRRDIREAKDDVRNVLRNLKTPDRRASARF